MKILVRTLTLAFLLVTAGGAFAQVPGWVREAMSAPVPSYPADVSAVVLLNEQSVTLTANGKLITTERYAVKLLTNEGRDHAVGQAHYLVSSGKVNEMAAWLIRGSAVAKEFDKKSIVDLIADPDDIYNEGRVKVANASRDALPGDVFAYTVESEDSPLFYQDIFIFQGRLPVLRSRYQITLPDGWKAASRTFNHAQIDPSQASTTYTWQLNNLPPIKSEPQSPSLVHLAPRIAVNYEPESGTNAVNKAFANWLDVSRWATSLYEPQVIIDAGIEAKARELTSGAKTELDKVKAIGTFVQNLQYISIDIGVGHGNGYKPRPSNLVLNRGYGDCKDKANLMRALLKVVGIDAYPIAIYSGDPEYVRAEWASPRQFNHCIIAVKVSEETNAATVMKHATLGRLLIFDATDPFTPVGDLPDYLQGGQGLIIAGEKGGLSQMPVTPPTTDLLQRRIEAKLDGQGGLTGTIRETANGQSSSAFRREVRELSAGDYKQAIEGWLTRGATGARLTDLKAEDRHSDAAFDLTVGFSAPSYGQVMQGRLLIFRPVIVGRRQSFSFSSPSRNNPIRLEPIVMKESTVFSLPDGYDVDELPEAVDLKTDFGSYKGTFEVLDGKLQFTRSIEIKRSLMGTERYDEVRGFFKKILDAEQSSVVLIRK